MQLATYIKDLLYRYECVILPGFGAFLTQHQSARIETTTDTFYPPRKAITFNRQLQTNDGLLANYVASVENCSYETALQKIRNFTGKLSLQLSARETVALKNVGEFFLNEENSVQFSPSNKENFSTSSFGLNTFSSSQISREVYKEAYKPGVNPSQLLFTPEKRETVPYFKYAAIALIAISISGLGGLKIYEGQVKNSNFVERQKANTLLENQIQEATFVIKHPLSALNLTLPKQIGNYHIVAGAFRVKENAAKKLNELLIKGYSAKSIGANKYGLHMVVYSSYENRRDAYKNLRDVKDTENKDAWILVRDLDN
ncbi:MAG: nucleoid DNA-binding protein [Ulvibacter sp.]|jgi:nucleoid DNA-binding protein